jgi:Tfp pilus assembly protein PilF
MNPVTASSPVVDRLLRLIEGGQDSAPLRLALAQALLGNAPAEARVHAARALELNPGYSAAWKVLGQAHAESGETSEACSAYRSGIDVAKARGDLQAAREMQVFLKRLQS